MVTTVLPAGDTIIFIGTHFDHTANEADRVLQAKRVNELLSGAPYPVILAGDLNAEPGSTPITVLEELWGSCNISAHRLHFLSKVKYQNFVDT